jgi:hypothetical protein
VITLFLLSDNLRRLTPRFLEMRPGARIVTNGYEIPGWTADRTTRVERDCVSWCTAYLYIVPARVAGTWQLPQGKLALEQQFQSISGTLEANGSAIPLNSGRVQGARIRFVVEQQEYSGRVVGDTIIGRIQGPGGGAFRAKRVARD